MDQIKDALDFIIRNKQIRTVYQPIISLRDGQILGHEALSRITCESEIKDTNMLFKTAGDYHRLWELELLCRTTALETAYKFMIPPYNKKLFINVNPHTMRDETYQKGFTRDFIEQYDIAPHKIIFEITERNVIVNMDEFLQTIDNYRTQDFKIAIDDAGAGYSGLNLISEVNPNFIKLDMKLIRDIDKNNLKHALIKGMVEFSKASNVYLIAEGIETIEELEALINLGVQYGQGYFIQRPNAEVLEIEPEVIKVINEINSKINHISQHIISNLYIRNLCTPIQTISPHMLVSDVYEIFRMDPNLMGLCVIEHDMPIGIVTKEKITYQLSGHFGFPLNQNKHISKLMDKNYLCVDHETSVSTVSVMAMARTNDKLYDFIVVTKNDKYVGVVTIKDLLQKTTEIEVSTAKHENPLTGLPGNPLIEHRLSMCIENDRPFSVAYLDIDNFKAYNDVYGFENGDLVIKRLADIIKTYESQNQFVGHIGGDDFVIIVDDSVKIDYFNDIVDNFENEVLSLYNHVDRENGYMIAKNRHGKMERFQLITLTIVVVNNNKRVFKDPAEVSEVLAGMKTVAKQTKAAM